MEVTMISKRKTPCILLTVLLSLTLSLKDPLSRTPSDGLSCAAVAGTVSADSVSVLHEEEENVSSPGLLANSGSTIDGDFRIGDPFVHSGKKYIPLVKAEKLTTDWDIGWIMPNAYIILSGNRPRVVEVPWSDFDHDHPASLIPGTLGTMLAIGPMCLAHLAGNVPVGPNLWCADRAEVVDGSLLFRPNLTASPVPFFTRLEALEMTTMVDWNYQVANYPEFYDQQTADLLRFNMTSSWVRIGDPAPDFEIPMVGGGTLKLSDYRGKIIAFNFCAVT